MTRRAPADVAVDIAAALLADPDTDLAPTRGDAVGTYGGAQIEVEDTAGNRYTITVEPAP